jgi:hypothetical protein
MDANRNQTRADKYIAIVLNLGLSNKKKTPDSSVPKS